MPRQQVEKCLNAVVISLTAKASIKGEITTDYVNHNGTEQGSEEF